MLNWLPLVTATILLMVLHTGGIVSEPASRIGISMGDRAAHTKRRAMGSCDIAQAALFADILSAEVATLRAQVRKAEKQWDDRRGRSRSDVDIPARLVRLREQLDEAKRLSALLRKVPTQ